MATTREGDEYYDESFEQESHMIQNSNHEMNFSNTEITTSKEMEEDIPSQNVTNSWDNMNNTQTADLNEDFVPLHENDGVASWEQNEENTEVEYKEESSPTDAQDGIVDLEANDYNQDFAENTAIETNMDNFEPSPYNTNTEEIFPDHDEQNDSPDLKVTESWQDENETSDIQDNSSPLQDESEEVITNANDRDEPQPDDQPEPVKKSVSFKDEDFEDVEAHPSNFDRHHDYSYPQFDREHEDHVAVLRENERLRQELEERSMVARENQRLRDELEEYKIKVQLLETAPSTEAESFEDTTTIQESGAISPVQSVASPALGGSVTMLRRELELVRERLTNKTKDCENLQIKYDDKVEELVKQVEKNYKLSSKLDRSKMSSDESSNEMYEVRTLLVQYITEEEDVDMQAYENVPIEELIRLATTTGTSTQVTNVRGSAKGRKRKDDTKDDEGALSRAEAMKLRAELRVSKQTVRKLNSRIDEIKEIEMNGIAALKTLSHLKKRSEELARRLHTEKDMRSSAEAELERSGERILALSNHIEKLMLHVKHEAAAKNTAVNELAGCKKEVTLLRQRNTVLTKKNTSAERLLSELREGSRILEDQLRLMDQKYVELRTKLDWTRNTSAKEVKKIQKEANKLRASFALALSKAPGNSEEKSRFKFGLMEGEEDNCDDSDIDDEDDPTVNTIPAEVMRRAAIQKLKDDASNQPLPAIESIIPAAGDRYQPRA